MAVCTAKHTKFQPTNAEWLCPKCGSNNEKFVIEMGAEGGDEDCTLLHIDDEITCMECHNSWNGAVVSKLLQKKSKAGDYVTCPCCKGVGRVKKT
jgi:hypothetical protein